MKIVVQQLRFIFYEQYIWQGNEKQEKIFREQRPTFPSAISRNDQFFILVLILMSYEIWRKTWDRNLNILPKK